MKVRDLKNIRLDVFIAVFAFWLVGSLVCSVVKSHTPYNGVNNCGKTYPIDYIFHTDLFCEIDNE